MPQGKQPAPPPDGFHRRPFSLETAVCALPVLVTRCGAGRTTQRPRVVTEYYRHRARSTARWQRHGECRASADAVAVRADTPTMQFDDVLGNRQPETKSAG